MENDGKLQIMRIFFQTALKPSTLDITRSKSNVLCKITWVVMMSFYDVMVNKDGHWATGYPKNGSILSFHSNIGYLEPHL